jgi:hypothetical protein
VNRRVPPPRGHAAIAVLLVAALLLPVGGAATHLPDHRFLVIGYVTDSEGRAIPGARVVVIRLKTGLEHPIRTEADGLYFVVLHLHDEDEGERLAIEVNGIRGEFRARFDVRDHKVERGTRLDIRGTRLVENRAAFAATMREYLSR